MTSPCRVQSETAVCAAQCWLNGFTERSANLALHYTGRSSSHSMSPVSSFSLHQYVAGTTRLATLDEATCVTISRSPPRGEKLLLSMEKPAGLVQAGLCGESRYPHGRLLLVSVDRSFSRTMTQPMKPGSGRSA